MKSEYTTSVKYCIKPRHKSICFGIFGERKVYDLYKLTKGERWDDPTYDNGGGNFIEFEETDKIKTFDLFLEADTFKTELELWMKKINL